MQVIIVCENQKKEVELSLDSIREYCDIENLGIIIADNHSEDGTREWANEQSDITYVYNDEEKMPFPKFINTIIKELEPDDDLLIMASPYAVLPRTFSNLINALYYSEDTVIAGGRSPSFSSNQSILDSSNDYEALFDMLRNISEDRSFEALTLCANVFAIKKDYLASGILLDERLTGIENVIDDLCISAVVKNKKIRVSMYSLFWSPSYVYLDHTNEDMWAIDCDVMMEKWNMRYFNLAGNGRIVTLIEEDVQKAINVLEIGCDCAGTLLLTKSIFPKASLYGTDICEASLNIAKHAVNACYNNIEDMNIPFTDVKFDYIIFGDVLEHLREPLSVVKYCRELLKDGGYILASIPNFMNVYVMEELLHGYFTYQETGLLDRTHIHMFTYKEIIKMFKEAGYEITTMNAASSDISEDADKLIDKLMSLGSGVERHMYTTFQYLVKAKKIN